jgi:hypothetical protein
MSVAIAVEDISQFSLPEIKVGMVATEMWGKGNRATATSIAFFALA